MWIRPRTSTLNSPIVVPQQHGPSRVMALGKPAPIAACTGSFCSAPAHLVPQQRFCSISEILAGGRVLLQTQPSLIPPLNSPFAFWEGDVLQSSLRSTLAQSPNVASEAVFTISSYNFGKFLASHWDRSLLLISRTLSLVLTIPLLGNYPFSSKKHVFFLLVFFTSHSSPVFPIPFSCPSFVL